MTIASVSFYSFSQMTGEKQKEIVKRKTVSFSFVGDLMCHSPQFEAARVNADSFDFRPAFDKVQEILSTADFTIGNLETVNGGKELRYSGYPMFNTPEEYLAALKDAGFDVLITSNNHSMDRGVSGINKTIDNLNKYGLLSFGTYKTEQDRDSILIIEKNGIKVALLAYSYGLNGNNLPKQNEYAVNLIDTLLIQKDVLKAKEKSSDVVITYFHFGEEYQREPSVFQKEIATKAIKYGADIIIASHPHVIQPIEFFENTNSKLDQGFTAFSLGNFFSNQRWRYSDCGVVLNFTIEKINNKLILDTVSIDPVWVSKEMVRGKYIFKILPSDTSSNETFRDLNKTEQTKLLQSYKDTQEIMNAVKNFKQKNSLQIN
ncbi:MAG: poly-gamma-glutamate synthesis protein (capsule biosynthesis protein) [Ignavibacteria bacterium]|nr:MAG: poly-gamma-glutamate synthesis protein (capsule biosynthesis protein) [Ignavibacteria bacterium]KAF0161960.1 MAG: poly-gamma-glutamate synthesis protein (capsule biosynthesis protein) [Ignavibacteria bacterium]